MCNNEDVLCTSVRGFLHGVSVGVSSVLGLSAGS